MNADTETFLARYRVVAAVAPRLGGEAFLCEDVETQNRVEVHRLEASEARERAFPLVRRAIEALAERPSSALARPLALEWGPAGELILAQEFHEGEALPAALAHGKPADPRTVVRGVLHGLASANRRGLTHGALCPARVLLRSDGGVSLLDVGVTVLAVAPAPAEFVAPGNPGGERADAYALAALARGLCGPDLATPLGPRLAQALEAIARADGSARTHDAGALLSLLPSRSRRRHARFQVSEVWDGGIGAGTQDLFRLAQEPEFAGRMPAEVSGNAPLASGRLDDLRFMQTLTQHPAPEPAPPKPEAVQPPAPEPVAVEPPPPEPDPATPIEDLATVYEPPPPPPPPLPQAPEPPPSLSGQPTLPPGGIQVRVRPATRRFRGTTTISQLPAIRGPILARVAGEPHATFLIGVGATPSLGRERTNEVVLRAFKNQVVDSVASNRLSRKHLELDRGPEGFTVTDLKSAYGTELNGARLAPRTPTLLAPSFRLDLANQAAGLVGRCLDGALDLRRDDACGHRYLLVWPGARVPVGGADAGGLPLGGVGVCGWLSFDPELERFTLELAEGIDAQFGPARVQTGVPHPLVSGSVLVGGVELRMRALNAPYDFFSVGDKLAV